MTQLDIKHFFIPPKSPVMREDISKDDFVHVIFDGILGTTEKFNKHENGPGSAKEDQESDLKRALALVPGKGLTVASGNGKKECDSGNDDPNCNNDDPSCDNDDPSCDNDDPSCNNDDPICESGKEDTLCDIVNDDKVSMDQPDISCSYDHEYYEG